MLRADIIKIFQICGYTLLYAFAAVIAGLIGRFAVVITEKCILKRLFTEQLKPYTKAIEISQSFFALICATGVLIVAVGLLFMHLIGLLPPEYDEIAVQVLVAFFGLAVFVCMCLAITIAGAAVLWTRQSWWKVRRFSKCADEEAGLLKDARSTYGTEASEDTLGRPEGAAFQSNRKAPHVQVRCAERPTTEPSPTWIKMVSLSSVRNLDIGRMRQNRRAGGMIYPRGRSVG